MYHPLSLYIIDTTPSLIDMAKNYIHHNHMENCILLLSLKITV